MEHQLANCFQITNKSPDFTTTVDIKNKLLELTIWDRFINPDQFITKFLNRLPIVRPEVKKSKKGIWNISKEHLLKLTLDDIVSKEVSPTPVVEFIDICEHEEEVGLEEHKIKRTKTENQRHLYECVTLPFTELDNVKIQPSCQVILFLEIALNPNNFIEYLDYCSDKKISSCIFVSCTSNSVSLPVVKPSQEALLKNLVESSNMFVFSTNLKSSFSLSFYLGIFHALAEKTVKFVVVKNGNSMEHTVQNLVSMGRQVSFIEKNKVANVIEEILANKETT